MTKHNELGYGLPKITVHQTVKNEDELKKTAETQRERINWAESLLNIPAVWIETQGEGVKVAVLDTGINLDHPDLADAVRGLRGLYWRWD